jgi:fructokinase
MYVPHEPFENGFEGTCSFHTDCLEGIASGSAMKQRWNTKAQDINSEEAWQLEAQYLGTAVANLVMSVRPELFILGGGVMNREGLIENIRVHVQKRVNSYVDMPPLDTYVVASTSPNNAVLGAIKLAAAL